MLRLMLSVWLPQAEKHRGIEPAPERQAEIPAAILCHRVVRAAEQGGVATAG